MRTICFFFEIFGKFFMVFAAEDERCIVGGNGSVPRE